MAPFPRQAEAVFHRPAIVLTLPSSRENLLIQNRRDAGLLRDEMNVAGDGEPMLQARGLADVAAGCRALGLSVMVFTWYVLSQLKSSPMPCVSDLLALADILVDGPFISEKPEPRRNWAGSTNQRFYFLTNRYNPGIEYDAAFAHGFELRIFGDGTLRSNGWPSGIRDQLKSNHMPKLDKGD